MSLPFVIDRCYDSHVHWRPTGEVSAQIRVDQFAHLSDWKLPLQTARRRGDWRLLFGWDPDRHLDLKNITATGLDQLDAADPLWVSHRDGHASVLNSQGLRALGWRQAIDLPEKLRSFAEIDAAGQLTGVLREDAHFAAWLKLPALDTAERRHYLLSAQTNFLQAGFTHIREMMADAELLADAQFLENTGSLKLYVDFFLKVDDLTALPNALQQLEEFKRVKTQRLRIQGVKVFLDGALGSEGAALSFPYSHSHKQAQLLWPTEDLRELLRKVWGAGARVAVHAIGDAALTQVLEVAQSLKADHVQGGLSIEHAEVVNPTAFKLMRDLDLEFHFQPSHYLSDRQFLKEKLGERWAWIFPWHRIEVLGFPIFFGSDTPIEAPSLQATWQALQVSAQDGVPALQLDWKFAHSHPDRRFGKECRTTIGPDAEVLRVEQAGKILYQRPKP